MAQQQLLWHLATLSDITPPAPAAAHRRHSPRARHCPEQFAHSKPQFSVSAEVPWEETVPRGRNSSALGWGGGGAHFLVKPCLWTCGCGWPSTQRHFFALFPLKRMQIVQYLKRQLGLDYLCDISGRTTTWRWGFLATASPLCWCPFCGLQIHWPGWHAGEV